ncbi:ejaculatory bulb-specific protein 3-like [Euwallacea fornicatus]|uniref:ejaculatory bulb-specific protein 3-like n=1 Tax=Euwallacea fornicatus TaxID=995702 RepID=UPI00338F6515
MRSIVIVVFLVLIYFGVGIEGDVKKYSSMYDNIDYNEIIKSDRLLKNYVNCLMERGTCTPDANELKRVLPEALQSNCQECTEPQKKGVFAVIKHMIQNKQNWWSELQSKYDPDGVYWEKYKDQWKAEYDI